MKNDLGPKLRCVQSQRFAYTVAGARDQDNAILENVAPVLVIIWLDTQNGFLLSGSESYWSVYLSGFLSSFSDWVFTICRGRASRGSIDSSSFLGCIPSSTNFRAPGSTFRSSEPTARL